VAKKQSYSINTPKEKLKEFQVQLNDGQITNAVYNGLRWFEPRLIAQGINNLYLTKKYSDARKMEQRLVNMNKGDLIRLHSNDIIRLGVALENVGKADRMAARVGRYFKNHEYLITLVSSLVEVQAIDDAMNLALSYDDIGPKYEKEIDRIFTQAGHPGYLESRNKKILQDVRSTVKKHYK